MSIEKIELDLLRMPLVHYFETSFGREYYRTFILVKIFEDNLVGYGEIVASTGPFYSYETTSTAWHVLKDYFIPQLFNIKSSNPLKCKSALQGFRGHPMAKAGLELALWDLQAKKENLPLFKLYGGQKRKIPAGVSIGIQDTENELLERIRNFLNEGYKRIKLKIKPGWDIHIIKKVRDEFPNLLLQVDANGAYFPEDIAHLKKLDDFGLLMVEQPFAPYDLYDHSLLQKKIKTALCLDESITSLQTVRQAIEMKSCKIINIKVGRVGGISEAIKIHDYCQEKRIPVWCGGMLESGIGRAHNIHLSSLPNFSFHNDISASKRYYHQDIIEPDFDIELDGTIKVPLSPGIGVSPQEKRIEKARIKKKIFQP